MNQNKEQKYISMLVVDDEDAFRELLVKRLERRGISTTQASSAHEALEKLSQRHIDIVLLDVKMPGISGIEALGLIRERFPKVETIFLTGHSSAEDGVAGIKAGAFDYLTKPIEFDHLISKIHQAYEKIRREEEKLQVENFRAELEQQMIVTERLASLGTMAAGIAHEINNPLSIIVESAGWMSTLLSKDELTAMPHRDHFERAIEKIEKSAERARRITHGLLGFARKEETITRHIDLCEIVNESIRLVEGAAHERDVHVTTECSVTKLLFWSDPNLLRQVLVNLLSNAIHASEQGGEVRAKILPGDHEVSVSVHDQGKGIPKENLTKIFEPFFTTKPPGQGTGLGLSISRSIIEKLGGRLEVQSELGRGSSFTVILPDSTPTLKDNNR